MHRGLVIVIADVDSECRESIARRCSPALIVAPRVSPLCCLYPPPSSLSAGNPAWRVVPSFH